MKNKWAPAMASTAAIVAAAALTLASPIMASAAPRHHGSPMSRSSVQFDHRPSRGGYRALVSDGPGTGFGFHRLPLPYHVAAVRQRERQVDAVHSAVVDEALTSGGYYGFYGDSVYGAGNGAAYGVFDGADGYGSPYFAGYYGPGDGEDYGPFGHAYAD